MNGQVRVALSYLHPLECQVGVFASTSTATKYTL